MHLELDDNTLNDLLLLARAEGKDPSALLGELVRKAIADRENGSGPDADAIARSQHEEWERLDGELSKLPVSQKTAGFSGRKHDEALYGWKNKK